MTDHVTPEERLHPGRRGVRWLRVLGVVVVALVVAYGYSHPAPSVSHSVVQSCGY